MLSKRIQIKRYILVALSVLIFAIITTSVVSILLLREREVESWQMQLSNLSLVLAEQTSQTMSSSEMALDGIVERIHVLGAKNDTELRSKMSTEAVFQTLRDKISGLPQVDVATIVAANGDVINFTRSFPAPNINLSDRDYFKAQQKDAALGLFISVPVKNKGNGKWVFYLSRRLNDASGRFMGLVLIGISVDQFTDFYGRLAKNLGEGAAITLYRRDFSVLTRWPRKDETIGEKNLTGTSHMVVEEMKKADAVIYTEGPRFSAADAPVARMGAVRVLERFPMIVNLTITEEFFLANWHRASRTIVVIASGSILALVIAAIILLRISRQREQSTLLLKNLTDEIPGMLFQFRLFPDGRSAFTYANKGFLDMYGLEPEQLPIDGAKIFAFQHPEDADRLSASIQESARKLESWHLDYRLVLPGKGIVWRHGDAQPQKLQDGSILWHGYIADISERKKIESDLQKESEKNLALLRNASDGIHILDTSGNIIEISDSFCAMLGYTRDEMIGMNVSQWDANFSASELPQVIEQLFKNKTRAEFETRHRRKDGTIFDVQVSSFSLELDGKPVLFTSSRDITEHKQSENRFRAAVEAAPNGMIMVDAHGVIVMINTQICAMFGYAEGELIGHSIHLLLPEHLQKTHASHFNGFTSHPTRRMMGLGRDLFGQHKDGQQIQVEIGLSPLQINGVNHVLASVVDITERKQVEVALHESHQQMSSLLDSMTEGAYGVDINGKCTFVNPSCLRMLGYDHAEALIGKIIHSLIHHTYPDGRPYPMQDCGVRLSTLVGKPTHVDNEVHWRADGSSFPVEYWSSPIYRDGQIDGAMVTFIDITERKKMEASLRVTANELALANAQIEEERARLAERVLERTAQLQFANHAKDSFLATMSHEIRTPLGGLLGMMELLDLSHLDAKQHELLEAARKSGKSLLRIVNDILDWSKIEAGKLELAPRAATITDMLKSVASTYAQIASEKDIQLKFEVDPMLGAVHIFDPLRLSQILNNFTSNALKFTEHGAIVISAHKVALDNDVEEVRFCVKDSGVGIAPEQQQRLFQHYEQASADTARMYGGTGLGLSICRSLAELMDGTLSVESEPGSGSTFCISVRLPVARATEQRNSLQSLADKKASRKDETDISPLATVGQHISVLIVDDHPLNRMLLKQQLDVLGLHVESAADGVEALSKYQASPFDLIITDCHMPVMDGYELTNSIREKEQQAGGQRIPIIAWTANVLAEEEERCHAAGMNDLLTKPTELSDLRAMLLKWLVKAGVLAISTKPSKPNG